MELCEQMSFRYGENLLNLEAVALESIQDCIQNMQNYYNKPFDPKKDIYALTANIMAQLVSKGMVKLLKIPELTKVEMYIVKI